MIIPSHVLAFLWNLDIELAEDKMEELVSKSLAIMFKRDQTQKRFVL